MDAARSGSAIELPANRIGELAVRETTKVGFEIGAPALGVAGAVPAGGAPIERALLERATRSAERDGEVVDGPAAPSRFGPQLPPQPPQLLPPRPAAHPQAAGHAHGQPPLPPRHERAH